MRKSCFYLSFTLEISTQRLVIDMYFVFVFGSKELEDCKYIDCAAVVPSFLQVIFKRQMSLTAPYYIVIVLRKLIDKKFVYFIIKGIF